MAVLSDIHATTVKRLEKGQFRSWVVDGIRDAPNPLTSLENLVEKTPGLRADVLLCPGDLCDAADWDALPYAWREAKRIADLLGAEKVIATAGNHDIDTYHLHDGSEINDGLLRLGSSYPCHPGDVGAEYWASRIARVKGDDWQVVILNSCLMERLGKESRDHGRVDRPTLERIGDLVGSEIFPVNVLLCHHHPQPFTRLFDDGSYMKSGDQLVALLDALPSTWMIVHGHMHQPHLDYMGGTGAQSTRLVAGSVGANLYPVLGTEVRNQLHLIEFPIDECKAMNLTLAGEVRSWSWRAVTGWKRAGQGDGLPERAGFGLHRPPTELAVELISWATERGMWEVDRKQLERWQPGLRYLLPRDSERLVEELEDRRGCHVDFDRHGNITRVVLPRNA